MVQAASEQLAGELKGVLTDFMGSLDKQLNQAYTKVLSDMGGEIDDLRRPRPQHVALTTLRAVNTTWRFF